MATEGEVAVVVVLVGEGGRGQTRRATMGETMKRSERG